MTETMSPPACGRCGSPGTYYEDAVGNQSVPRCDPCAFKEGRMDTELVPMPKAPSSDMELIDRMIQRGADPAQLEKFMDLLERAAKRRAEERFAEAIAAFQSECPTVLKGRQADRYKFFSFDDVMREAGPVMAKHGISVAFDTDHGENGILKISVRVRVGSHYEDRKFSCPVPVSLKVNEPQQFGAAMTYAKRYALCAAMNIVGTDQDNDAAGLYEFITKDQVASLKDLIDEKGADFAAFLKFFQVEALEKLPAKQLAKAVDMLNRRPAKAKVAK